MLILIIIKLIIELSLILAVGPILRGCLLLVLEAVWNFSSLDAKYLYILYILGRFYESYCIVRAGHDCSI